MASFINELIIQPHEDKNARIRSHNDSRLPASEDEECDEESAPAAAGGARSAAAKFLPCARQASRSHHSRRASAASVRHHHHIGAFAPSSPLNRQRVLPPAVANPCLPAQKASADPIHKCTCFPLDPSSPSSSGTEVNADRHVQKR